MQIKILFNICILLISFHFSAAFDHRLAVSILRIQDGLDYSKVIGDEDNSNAPSADITLTSPPSRSHLHNVDSSHMLHADSNLNIANIAVSEGVVAPAYPIISKYSSTIGIYCLVLLSIVCQSI